ncbi:DsrE family protein [Bradyrhizobium sp. CB2312]|uniref:DsrE family protein n=1 Tax=Bradyrhizobium sp. CB2312 TaxID=3039155 RepID=UPI0024B195AB|nr:DsrE family protein [Bradyrhizobium sp. CB2312]WFU75514.1 DsrE family protein [Bradyrhizobium sp. CB2312]
MSISQRIAKAAAIGAFAVLLAAQMAAAEQGGRYWVPSEPTTMTPAPYPALTTPSAPTSDKTKTNRAPQGRSLVKNSTKRFAAKQPRKRPSLEAMAADSKTHRLILQVNTNDAGAMNLALNNAANVTQHYGELGEKVKIEVITFGPGLHMLRDDTSPVKARIEQMALSMPEVSFKACGNTQEKMHEAEHKDIPIVSQAQVVKSGVVRVMELQETGWTYVKP